MPGDLDYKGLGFKCGLEIHQQLDTERKLFCKCKVQLRRDAAHAAILRHMRPTLSEMGTYDGTALMEFKTRKNVTYQLYEDGICTYEMDDTPPFPINQKAVDIGLEIALMLGCSVVDEVHVSRKQYLDGSIPTGFQRTAIIGVEGSMPFKGRQLGIIQLSIEEDACREVSDRGHEIVFKTDRLSTPLVEVVTKAEIFSPSEVPEAAEQLGRFMRATGKVRRGMGATRQDVNVSITGGTRVEIKGVPKLQWMEALTRNEAIRQKALLGIRDTLKAKGMAEENLQTPVKDLAHLFKKTKCEPIAAALAKGGAVQGIRLGGFAGILNTEVMPGIPLKHEFAGRVKVIACLDDPLNIIHTDELPAHNLSEKDKAAILKEMGCGSADVAVLAWGPAQDVETAMREIRLRALDALVGVPSETRQPFADGTSGFERILPGPDRMYPDTDSPPTEVTQERIDRIRAMIVEPPWEREERYLKMGVPGRVARDLAISQLAKTFEELVGIGFPARQTASFLVEGLRSIRRRGMLADGIDGADITAAFMFARASGMSLSVVPAIVAGMGHGELASDAAARAGVSQVAEGELLAAANEVSASDKFPALMARFRGMASAERVRKALQPE
ncbi:MAG: Glu-tRNA(Gln) amidotransferase subunit GatE [Methanobacteriota archaeon]